ncbi:response regulator [Chitinophaga horti]|uniref:Response regulator n=1 Tax=Chitinophaga horti TaxID=2920382 RepID=A0ABY6IVV2_9BACT|nr:response regulator [Chitinophaga horti]UYQ91363.1 response regulator [Chitinophaga horti]
METLTCLLIDDDADDLEFFTLAIQRLKEQVHCIAFDDGAEALKKLSDDTTLRPDFIFLDLNMPRIQGKQILKEMKKLQRLDTIPVIIYSTSSETHDMEETKALGAADYIVKAPSIKLLSERLEQVINLHKKPFSSI